MRKWIAGAAAASFVASLAGLVFLSFAYANLRKQVVAIAAAGTSYGDMRLAVIEAQLWQLEHPIVVIGDSVVETAPWPKTVCGHPVINAGVGGARVGFVPATAPRYLGKAKPALVILAIGINDAGKSYSESSFRSDYSQAIQSVPSPVAVSTIVAGHPVDLAEIERFNNVIGQLAEGRTLIDLHKAVPGNITIDGIHLNGEGYKLWMTALVDGARRAIGCTAPDPLAVAGANPSQP